ncbi:UNVERIFIED_CONTAM: hypothetical protein HDU68_012348 [Siphonaria sp. JEL0065]|nr:hypothetical protein HDU68_012348 [Siphonaria sp. JEL0065]
MPRITTLIIATLCNLLQKAADLLAVKGTMFRSTRFFSSAIPNTGSTARDHLANERTFLAWSRTGLGFVGLGIALETFGYQRQNQQQPQQGLLQHQQPHPSLSTIASHVTSSQDRLASATLIGMGGMFLAFGTVRYFNVLRLLTQGKFQPNTKGIGMMVASSFLITGTGLATVLIPDGSTPLIKSRINTSA